MGQTTVSEVIQSTLESVSAGLNDQLQAVENLAPEAAGAQKALKALGLEVAKLSALAKKEVDEANLELDTAKILFRHLARVVAVIENSTATWKVEEIRARGMADGVRRVTGVVEKMATEQAQKAAQRAAAPEGGKPVPVAEQRRQMDEEAGSGVSQKDVPATPTKKKGRKRK